MQKEAEVLRGCAYQSIVRLVESFVTDEKQWIVMEWCEGPDLETMLRTGGALPEKQVRGIVRQLLMAVRYLHSQRPKIIHFDLNLQNVCLGADGLIKLVDFESCLLLDGALATIAEGPSTPHSQHQWVPPECLEATPGTHKVIVNDKVDMWCIGAIALQLLYGRKPPAYFHQDKGGKGGDQLQIRSLQLPDSPGVSVEMKEFIKRCLSENSESRLDAAKALQGFPKRD
jgi:cell cycle serine/threonine-protein kinase CDC5/MSD2